MDSRLKMSGMTTQATTGPDTYAIPMCDEFSPVNPSLLRHPRRWLAGIHPDFELQDEFPITNVGNDQVAS